MAGLQTRKRGGKTAYQIQFFDCFGKRKTLYLGAKYDAETSEEIRRVVEKVVDAITTDRALDRRTTAWLGSMTDDLRERFVSAGLLEEIKKTSVADLWDAYFEAESRAFKPTTQDNKLNAYRRFTAFFDPNTPADEITKRDAQNFADDLDRRYKEATRAGTIRDVRRVWNWGIENEIVEKNPFANINRGSFKNKAREHFVSRDDYQKMLDACPNVMFRVLIALYRIGGLRKEEALRATWNDVKFDVARLIVHSPKTERYKGKETRIIPLFPELKTEIESLRQAQPNAAPNEFLISTNRTTIFKRIEQIIFNAGLPRWERICQNMRSTRAIEVYEQFGDLAESAWIGHSPKTAKEHYLHVREEIFDVAAGVAGCDQK